MADCRTPELSQDVLVRDLSLAWPSGAIGPHWTVWCRGEQRFAFTSRDEAVTCACVEAAALGVAAWLDSHGGRLKRL